MKNLNLHQSVYNGKHTLTADTIFVSTVDRGNVPVTSSKKPTG
jgi:hypothetical protein